MCHVKNRIENNLVDAYTWYVYIDLLLVQS